MKPTVLLVDDDESILRATSRVLALETDFDIVATVTDAARAVDVAHRLRPDIVVVDINMPHVDGFQTAERLKRDGSRARIVFLTADDDDDRVIHAMRCGVTGYVVKPRTWSDLPTALYQALEDRHFLPSLSPLAKNGWHSHSVRFHENTDAWLDESAHILTAALRHGDTVALALTRSHCEAVVLRMRQRGCDITGLEKAGRVLVFDAAEALTQIVPKTEPDAEAIAETVDGLERARAASAVQSDSRLVVLGEIAVPLLESGNVEAVLQLERLWNELTCTLPFLTICAYPMACFGDPERGVPAHSDVCARHSVISHT